jgi:hypothetical protein
LIHAALYPYPEHLVLVSKVGAECDAQGGWIPAERPEQLLPRRFTGLCIPLASPVSSDRLSISPLALRPTT